MAYPLAAAGEPIGAQGAGGEEYFRLLTGLFVFAAILFGAWLVLKWLSRKNSLFGRGGHMKVLDRLYLGKDSYIALVELGGKILAVGVCKDGMNTLSSFSPSELELEAESEAEKKSASPGTFGIGRFFKPAPDGSAESGGYSGRGIAFGELLRGAMAKSGGEAAKPVYTEAQDSKLDSMYDALSKRTGKYAGKQR